MGENVGLLPPERIERSILLIRGHKVMLDSDLASLYGVTTKRLNEQVKRNRARFQEDFMFQLTVSETEILRSQFATTSRDLDFRRSYLMRSPNMARSWRVLLKINQKPF